MIDVGEQLAVTDVIEAGGGLLPLPLVVPEPHPEPSTAKLRARIGDHTGNLVGWKMVIGLPLSNSGQIEGQPDSQVQSTRHHLNVTHRVCTHRLQGVKIEANACRYSLPVWPCHSSHPRGAGDQSGRGGGTVRATPDILLRR